MLQHKRSKGKGANRVKQKCSGDKVTMPCHFGARLNGLLVSAVSSKARFATLCSCLELCPPLSLTTYACIAYMRLTLCVVKLLGLPFSEVEC